jgi:hypothetical protein
MPIFEIGLPDGRTMEAEAPDEATALRGAQEWFAANPTPAPSPKGSNQEVTTPGVIENMRRSVTGEGRSEFPEAREFAQALPEETRRSLLGTDAQQANALSMLSPDENAQLDILKSRIPGLESRRDAQGNLMLRAPQAGVADWTYLNAPGLSRRDLGEFTAQTVATLPFGGLIGRGASVVGRAGYGALAGAGSSVALDTAASAAGSERGIDLERAGLSAAMTGALAPILGRAAAPRAPSPTQATLEAADRINVPIPQAMASDSLATRMVAGSTSKLPFGSPLEGAAENVVRRLGSAADDVAAELGTGGPGTAFNAGDGAREAMIHWIHGQGPGTARAVDERLYGGVTRQVNPNVTIPLAETRVMVQTLMHEMQQSGGIANRGAIAPVLEAVNRRQGLNFEGVHNLRTEIGAMLDGSIIPQPGTPIPALRRIYEALTVDRNRIAQLAGGPRAVVALNRADRVHEQIVQRRNDLARIIGERADVAPERVFDRVAAMAQTSARADLDRLDQVRRVMGGDAWNELSSAVVTRLGRGPDDQFTPRRFLTAYSKLSDEGKQRLFNSTGRADLRQALDDIATVSRRYEDVMSKYANPSGTGRAVTSLAGISGLMVAPLETLGAAIGGYGLAALLSRPATARNVANWSNAYFAAATAPSQATLLVLSQQSQKLADALSGEAAQ